MKITKLTTALASAALAVSAPVAAELTTDQRAAVERVLESYETALNAQDTESILGLYTKDGVFMPQHSLPQEGIDAIRAAYTGVFQAITLDIDFIVDEIEPLSNDWAYARTRSEGSVTINATGDVASEANQELFLLNRQEDGSWKIARYIFSTTNPPRN